MDPTKGGLDTRRLRPIVASPLESILLSCPASMFSVRLTLQRNDDFLLGDVLECFVRTESLLCLGVVAQGEEAARLGTFLERSILFDS